MADQNRERAFAQELFKRINIEPENLESGERPDLRFSIQGKTIGMEVTESTPSEIHWGRKIIQDLSTDPLKPIIYSTSHLDNHGIQRTRDELLHDMLENTEWVGMIDSLERWCKNIRDQWDRKRKKLNEDTYNRFDANWLLIWDNVGLGNDIWTLSNIQSAISQTQRFLTDGTEFDRVYVISSDYTFLFEDGGVNFMHLHADDIKFSIIFLIIFHSIGRDYSNNSYFV